MPDRQVFGLLEIDPARVGWRIEATVHQRPDSDEMDSLVREVHQIRAASVQDAVVRARLVATALWVAIRAHLEGRDQ